MGKNFLPKFVIAAALTTALIWRLAPAIDAKLSPDARDKVHAAIRACTGRGVFIDRDKLPPFLAFLGSERPRDPNEVDVSYPNEAPAREMPVGTATSTNPPAKPTDSTVDLDELPSRKGIVQTDPETATWGVLNRVTLAMGLDGDPIGTVKGGRFFLIERRFHDDDGFKVVGNFTPRRLARQVILPAVNLYCFTGDPSKLSDRQRECLRKYYELRGEAEELKAKLIQKAAERSPYYKPAVAALREFRARAAQAEQNSAAASEENRQATYDLNQLRTKVQELNQKHKDWKAAHASELPDPTMDPEYIRILEVARKYAGPIGGMTY